MSAQMLAKENEIKRVEKIIHLENEKIKLENTERKSEESELINNSLADSETKQTNNIIKATAPKLRGIKDTGEKIDLNLVSRKTPVASSNIESSDKKKKRKRIIKPESHKNFKPNNKKSEAIEIDPEEAQKKVREHVAVFLIFRLRR